MNRNYIRSYRITESGDIEVIDWRGGETVNLSRHYADTSRDRSRLQLETSLDVFRFTDGQLTWSASSNGQGGAAAASLSLLLGLFVEDVYDTVATPRSF